MRTLIIGGTGFISGRLAHFLLASGHSVTVLTRGTHGLPKPLQGRVEVLKGDRTDPSSLKFAVQGKTFDAVFDMVAYEPEESRGAVRVFKGRTGRFIHCSTVSVYMVSNDVACPITEDQDRAPLMQYWPRNPFGMSYGVSKRGCEDVLWDANDSVHFPVSMLRPTYVSGPEDTAARDYFWIERILDGKPVLISGAGEHPFQQVFVDDVARAFASLLEHPVSVGKAYNVASEEVMTQNEYLAALCGLLGRTPELIHVPEERIDAQPFGTGPGCDVFPFNTRRTAVFSLDAITRDLGYRSTPFREWMPQTITWFTRHVKGHSCGYQHRDEEVAFVRTIKGENLP